MKTPIVPFDNRSLLLQKASSLFQEAVTHALDTFGEAHVLLAGGTSPAFFYRHMASLPLPWERIYIGLTDDRLVPESHPLSNMLMVKKSFEDQPGEKAQFVSMVIDASDPLTNLEKARLHYHRFIQRTDFTLLGMGADGHIASLFPDDEDAVFARSNTADQLYNTLAPIAPFNRISCGMGMLLKSNMTLLLLSGEDKRKAISSLQPQPLPVQQFLTSCVHCQILYFST
jgi:6-phosphogluconolactonase